MIQPIRIYGDPVLEQPCAEVTDFSSTEVKTTVKDLLDTCHATANSAGLSAPQIGVLQRVIVVRTIFDKDDTDSYMVLVNPRILSQRGLSEEREGCLSIPGHFDKIARPDVVTVQYQDEHSEVHTVKGTGFFARALVHEIDHLDGRLFIHYFGNAYCAAVKEWLGRQSPQRLVEEPHERPMPEQASPTSWPRRRWHPPAPDATTSAQEASPLPEASFVQAEHAEMAEDVVNDDTSGEMADRED